MGQPTVTTPVTSAKVFYKSWTIWFNVLSFLLVILNQALPIAPSLIHDAGTAKNVGDLISAIIVVVNVLLRFKTTNPVKLTNS